MTLTLKTILNRKLAQSIVIVLGIFANTHATAATVAIASAPLVSATTTQVLPNLMYILDNSGSMGSEYMPDYVDDGNKCKSTGTSGEFSASCNLGDPPFNTNFFNTLAYNPTITYSPAMESNGVEKISMNSANTTGWTVVPRDAYGVYSSANDSLIPNVLDASKGYPDKVWCNTTTATAADLINPLVCKKNGPQYIYPNNTGTQATSFNQPYTLRGNPYYYTVSPGEYCTDKNLTNCITSTTPTGTHTFPATLRWCNSSGRTNCQAKYLDSTGYTFAKWSGINNGTSATGRIRINAESAGCGGTGQPSCNAPSVMNVTDITVNGVRIVASPVPNNLTITNTTASSDRDGLASRIRDAINNFVPTSGDDFTATVSGNEVTITRVGPGAFMGTIDVTASSVNRVAVAGTNSTGRITVTRAGKTSRNSTPNATQALTECKLTPTATSCAVTITISEIRVGNPSSTNINSGNIVYTTTAAQINSATTQNALATLIRNNINAAISAPQDYTATCGGLSAGACTTNQVDIRAVNQTPNANGTISITASTSPDNANFAFTKADSASGVLGIPAKTYTIPTLITQFTGGTSVVNTFNRIDIEPATTSYTKAITRTDCLATTCTYAEELTNFANWYSYYRNRMMMMKTSTSRAFKSIDTRYRVGFITINSASSNYLPIDNYNATQKASWYTKLFAAGGGSGTPLRQSLSTVGRIFAGKKPVGTSDPVQYSCQQNFALLTTDGYWNGSGGKEINGTTDIGNMDGGSTGRPQYEGPTASSNGLADTAKYYYDTDLRNTSQSNCTGALGTDVCADNVFISPNDNNVKQHMTTFTLGLGVDGELSYTSDYRTATSGDYYDIKQGTKDWSVPTNDSQRSVDDLWHAAVNGQGTYFSAQDPNQLNASLTGALQAIGAKVGAGAAAATSTLNPVAGDNFAYVASYTTVKWTGNLESREINLSTGEVSEDATWCVETVAAGSCAAPSLVVAEDVAGATVSYCSTPGATAASCPSPGVLDGTDCKVEIASSCIGRMTDNVGPNLSNRTILIKDGATNNLVNFNYANLSATQKPFFENTWLAANLSHWSALTLAQQSIAGGVNIVNFLRGETGFEDRASNLVGLVDNRLFRLRESTLGDALESTPVFVGPENNNFNDANYNTGSSFKAAQQSRAGTVYMGTNDGMLHAFDSASGEERWAYIPSMVIPNMYKLADKNYANLHANYVNGDAIRGAICSQNCSLSGASGAVWKTVLVGGLNGGGRGYYALDITNPTAPSLLWEFSPSNDADLGLSFGNAEITKKADGTWVVLVTSGYNNTTGPNAGRGILYVLNANTGAIISKYNTGVGSAATPSGLAKISAYVTNPNINNQTEYVYGGDLLGNLWRFDINAPQSASNPFKFAILKDSSGNPQPITTRPTLTSVAGKRFIVVGTGKYLEVLDLTDTQQQTLYAMTDDSSVVTTLDNPRTSSAMVNQVLINNGAQRKLQTPENPVDYSIKRGWFINLPDGGERINVASKFVAGVTLLVPTIVPSSTVCSPGGYGWLNFINYKTGGIIKTPAAANIVATKVNAPIVGMNVVYINGKPVVSVVTSDKPTPELVGGVPAASGGTFANRRMIWRELLEDE
jgi:type IV pilus assembly protein PilY1